jgi:hypothetical protein
MIYKFAMALVYAGGDHFLTCVDQEFGQFANVLPVRCALNEAGLEL